MKETKDSVSLETIEDNRLDTFSGQVRLDIQPMGSQVHTILYCHHYSEISGGETSLLELFRHIDRNRFRPILAAPGTGPFIEAAQKLDVEVFPVDFGRLREIGRLMSTVRLLQDIARESGATLLHSNGPITNLPAAVAARLSGLQVIWHARTCLGPNEFDLDRFLSPISSLIIANSDNVRARFDGSSAQKSLTIINGVDTERFHPAISGACIREIFGACPEHILVGVVGRIAPIKGQRTFIEAATSLIPRHPDLRFLIIGAGLFEGEKAHEAELRNLVKEKGLDDRIFFTGYQTDVTPFMAALDISVIPSDAEACGRALLESMAMGKPVIGTNTGGTPEVIQDSETGILIPPRDAEALSSALEHIVSDPIIRARMGEAGRRRVEDHFTIQANARKTERVYLQLLSEQKKHG